MKKLLTLLVAICAFTFVSNAQFGLRGGLNLANQTFDVDGVSISPESTIGFQIGATYTSALNENIMLRPGLLLSTKGSKIEFLGEESTSTFTYLEIPVDFVYNTGMIGIHAGPYLGFLLAADNEGNDIKDEAESLDFGLNIGASYNFTEKIGLGLNYGLGLANLSKEDGDEAPTINNRVFSLFVTYAL